MKSYSEIMTSLAHKSSMLRQLNEEESRMLKSTLLEMYKDLNMLCQNHNLKLILVGGSALGCIRHSGFIPWDDDLDVALSRNDYKKLINAIENGELNSKYEFTYPSEKKDSKNQFLKIYLKNSVNTEIMDLYSPFPKGVFIDVFPIDFACPPGIKNKTKSFISHLLTIITSGVLITEYPSPEYKQFISQSKEGKNRYRLMKFIGSVCSFISHKNWINFFDKFVQGNSNSGYVTIPAGRKGYSGETVKYDVMFPAKEGIFEGMKVHIPANSHKYLENLYGDYMTLPAPDKRERHHIVEFEIKK